MIAEIATLKKRKVVREQDLTLHRKRSESETEYARLRKADPKAIFPSFPEFRKLSVVKTVEASSSAKNASFTDPFVASLLKESLDQWRDAARAALAVVLGFTGWKTMSKKKLHPVDRMTAHFRCKRCDAAGKDTGKDGGLDLARACEHICALSKKARNKQRWSADYFVPDQRVRSGTPTRKGTSADFVRHRGGRLSMRSLRYSSCAALSPRAWILSRSPIALAIGSSAPPACSTWTRGVWFVLLISVAAAELLRFWIHRDAIVNATRSAPSPCCPKSVFLASDSSSTDLPRSSWRTPPRRPRRGMKRSMVVGTAGLPSQATRSLQRRFNSSPS